jgi:hypothetical protein
MTLYRTLFFEIRNFEIKYFKLKSESNKKNTELSFYDLVRVELDELIGAEKVLVHPLRTEKPHVRVLGYRAVRLICPIQLFIVLNLQK